MFRTRRGLTFVTSMALFVTLLALTAPGLALAAPAISTGGSHSTTAQQGQHVSRVSPLTPTCSGHGCDGKDPYQTGCAGSGASYYVAASVPLLDSSGNANWSYGYVQIWWSNTCRTNWGRIVVSNGTPGAMEIGLQGDYNPNVCGEGQNPGCNGQNSLVSPQYYLPSIKASAFGNDTTGFSYYYNETPWV